MYPGIFNADLQAYTISIAVALVPVFLIIVVFTITYNLIRGAMV